MAFAKDVIVTQEQKLEYLTCLMVCSLEPATMLTGHRQISMGETLPAAH